MIWSPAKILATILVTDGFGGWQDADPKPDWGITYSELPEEPTGDSLIAVKDSGGLVDSQPMRRAVSEKYSVQIFLRTGDEDKARLKWLDLVTALDNLYQRAITVDSIEYTINHFSRSGQPMFLRQLERYNQRDYVLNGRLRFL